MRYSLGTRPLSASVLTAFAVGGVGVLLLLAVVIRLDASAGDAVYAVVRLVPVVVLVVGLLVLWRQAVLGRATTRLVGETVWDRAPAAASVMRGVRRAQASLAAFRLVLLALLVSAVLGVGAAVAGGADTQSVPALLGAAVVSAGLLSWMGTRGKVVDAALRATGAVVADPEVLGALVPRLEGVCIGAGLAITPVLHLVDSESVNAFVVGDLDRSAVGLTRGMLQKFDSDEIEAVLASLVVRVTAGVVSDAGLLRCGRALHSVLYGRRADDAPALTAADHAAVYVLRNPEPYLRALNKTDAVSDTSIPGLEGADPCFVWALERGPRDYSHQAEKSRLTRLRQVLGAQGRRDVYEAWRSRQ